MQRPNSRALVWVMSLLVIVTTTTYSDEPTFLRKEQQTPAKGDATSNVTLQQMMRIVLAPPKLEQQQLRAARERSRGASAEVYPKAAPAVVFIRTPNAHGTGFFISDDGWILTNWHVIDDALQNPSNGYREVTVVRGELLDGFMQVNDEPLVASVYKASPEKDLALLKLVSMPAGLDEVPFVKLAERSPTIGMDCVAIGHPGGGLLWMARSGEVAGIGMWPRDAIDNVVHWVVSHGAEREAVKKMLGIAGEQRKDLHSTCGVNPGDSGGPLLSKDGEVIAVTWGIPSDPNAEGISFDKFSYHVHLDEVRAFLEDRPVTPEVFVPDVWPLARGSLLVDADSDEKPDTAQFLLDEQTLSGTLFDLDQDSPSDFKNEHLAHLDKRLAWDFEFGFCRFPRPMTFYDTDNDGNVDLFLIDQDGDDRVDLVLTKKDDRWQTAPSAGLPGWSDSYFQEESLREQMRERFSSESSEPAVPPAPIADPDA